MSRRTPETSPTCWPANSLESPSQSERNRYRVALDKPETREADVYLLDDGFQHIKLKRNLDILLWDAAEPLSRLELLPAGRLREPFSAIERADLVVVTHAHLTFDYEALERQDPST